MNLDIGSLLLSMIIGSIGLGLFLYGKKQVRVPQLVAGVALMVYPYFISNLWLMSAIAVALLALLWATVKLGY